MCKTPKAKRLPTTPMAAGEGTPPHHYPTYFPPPEAHQHPGTQRFQHLSNQNKKHQKGTENAQGGNKGNRDRVIQKYSKKQKRETTQGDAKRGSAVISCTMRARTEKKGGKAGIRPLQHARFFQNENASMETNACFHMTSGRIHEDP